MQRNSKKFPDLIGIDLYNKIYIFEAKGSTITKPMNNVIEKGIKQLESIQQIVFNSNRGQNYLTKSYSSCLKNNDERYVVATQPTSVNKNELAISVIDPLPKGEIKLELNIDYLTFKYYSFIMILLRESTIDKNFIPGFYVVTNEQKDILIGLKEEVFSILEEAHVMLSENKSLFKDFSNIEEMNELHKKISEYLPIVNITLPKVETWEISVGKDGILVGVIDKIRE